MGDEDRPEAPFAPEQLAWLEGRFYNRGLSLGPPSLESTPAGTGPPTASRPNSSGEQSLLNCFRMWGGARSGGKVGREVRLAITRPGITRHTAFRLLGTLPSEC